MVVYPEMSRYSNVANQHTDQNIVDYMRSFDESGKEPPTLHFVSSAIVDTEITQLHPYQEQKLWSEYLFYKT